MELLGPLNSLGPHVLLGVALGILIARQHDHGKKIESIINHLNIRTKKRTTGILLPLLLAAICFAVAIFLLVIE